jgi:protein-tyrosine-phosphatase
MYSLTLILTLFPISFLSNLNTMDNIKFYKKLMDYTTTLEAEFNTIDEARKVQLEELGEYIYQKAQGEQRVSVTVICTHNSRRSHMGQLWLDAAATYYGITNFTAASGGTEATAVNIRAIEALRDAGFRINQLNSGENPPYEASTGAESDKIHMFSKVYDHAVNPSSEFAAVMVCSEADASCPSVRGAEARIAIPYQDPKYSDDTPEEKTAYAQCCRQIAREMFYVMKYAKDKLILDAERAKVSPDN